MPSLILYFCILEAFLKGIFYAPYALASLQIATDCHNEITNDSKEDIERAIQKVTADYPPYSNLKPRLIVLTPNGGTTKILAVLSHVVETYDEENIPIISTQSMNEDGTHLDISISILNNINRNFSIGDSGTLNDPETNTTRQYRVIHPTNFP